MLCRNQSNSEVQFEIDRSPGQAPLRYKVPPGMEVDIEDGYCVPYRTANGRVMEPLITQISRIGMAGNSGGTPTMVPTGRYVETQIRGTLPAGAISQEAPNSLQVPELLQTLAAITQQMAAMQAQMAAQAAQLAAVQQPIAVPPAPAAPAGPTPPVALSPEQDSLGSDEDDLPAATGPAPAPAPPPSLGGGKGGRAKDTAKAATT